MKELLKEKKEKTKNPNAGHRMRLKERYLKVGYKGLHDVEKLELLLFFAIPQKDTKNTARNLIDYFGSLNNVFEANIDQLVQVKGVTPNAALLISMLLPLWNECKAVDEKRFKIKRPIECGKKLIEYYSGKDTEQVVALCIDPLCKIIAIEKICDGDMTSVLLNVKTLVEKVLKNSKATAVILAHNHPSGFALPSREDISSTIEIIGMMKTMGINVIDHFIIANNDYVSMAQSESFNHLFR